MFVVTIDTDKCTGCGECFKACPAQVIQMTCDKAEVVGEECMGCQSCMLVCQFDAVKVEEF